MCKSQECGRNDRTDCHVLALKVREETLCADGRISRHIPHKDNVREGQAEALSLKEI
jgi:hypothetical protein